MIDSIDATIAGIRGIAARFGEPAMTQLLALAAACEELKAENERLTARFAAINGQINVMANAVNGQRWEAYWTASDAAQKVINGDFDHAIGANFEAFRAKEADLARAHAALGVAREAIESAPHALNCWEEIGESDVNPCDCWKAAVLATLLQKP